VRDQYAGPARARFGPTLAAEHLACENGLQADAESRHGDRRWALAEELWSGSGSPGGTGEGARAKSTPGRWCRSTAVFPVGRRRAPRKVA
jgi:hypothetical protein